MLAASLQKPKAPWAITLGFLAALITIPISRAISSVPTILPLVYYSSLLGPVFGIGCTRATHPNFENGRIPSMKTSCVFVVAQPLRLGKNGQALGESSA